jgi:tRNA(Ile)-lysidine synthase
LKLTLLYHVCVHPLAQRLLLDLRREELLTPGGRVGVAVSGGIDSVALLHLLLELRHELGLVLSVVHFNHKLRGGESDADQEFVSHLAREHGLEFFCEGGDVAERAAEEHRGVEAAARELRYEFFRRLLRADEEKSPLLPNNGRNGAPAEGCVLSNLNKIATGHTLDDQAETVLMRLIRGTGTRGLGGIHPRVLVVDDEDEGESHGEIVRPLLGIRRRELQQYLTDLKHPWREDATNSDSRFTRNRVRKLLLPLIEREFNPSIVDNLSEFAEIARDEEDYWENEVSGWLGTVVQWSLPEWARMLPGYEDSSALVQIAPSGISSPNSETYDSGLRERIEQAGHAIANASLSRPWLLSESKAVQRRVIKAIGEQAGIPLEFQHVEEILRFAAEDGPAGKELALPSEWTVVREPEAMVFVTPDLRAQEPFVDYEYALDVPGRVFVLELGVVIEALRLSPDSCNAEYNPQQLLDAKLVPARLTLRNWHAGDRYWPAHSKSPKKVKELLQEKHIPQPQRKLWPVVANVDEIVWMRGFAVPAGFGWKRAGQAVFIREVPRGEHEGV